MFTSMSRLVLTSCSRRKRPDADLLPAMERYDGPTFRVLRRFLRECPESTLDAYILSAEFGLIAGHRLIPAYDQQLTPRRATQLETEVAAKIFHITSAKDYAGILVCAGGDYAPLLEQNVIAASPAASVDVASGTVGRQLTLLRRWLHGDAKLLPPQDVDDKESVTLSIRGTDVTLTPMQATERLRGALEAEQGEPDRFQSWYALIGERRVSIKWMVAQLTGLPVSAFHTDDAKRALKQLGIHVRAA